MASSYCWFNQLSVFICSLFVSGRTVLITTSSIQMQLDLSVWDDMIERWCGYFWGWTLLGHWLMIRLSIQYWQRNSQYPKFQLLWLVWSSYVCTIQPGSIGIWLTKCMVLLCRLSYSSCCVMQLHKSIGSWSDYLLQQTESQINPACCVITLS